MKSSEFLTCRSEAIAFDGAQAPALPSLKAGALKCGCEAFPQQALTGHMAGSTRAERQAEENEEQRVPEAVCSDCKPL